MKRMRKLGVVIVFLGIFLMASVIDVEAAGKCPASKVKAAFNGDEIKVDADNNTGTANFSSVSPKLYYRVNGGSKQKVPADGNFRVPFNKNVVGLEVVFYNDEAITFTSKGQEYVCDKDQVVRSFTVFEQVTNENTLYNSATCTNFINKYDPDRKDAALKRAVPYCYVKRASNIAITELDLQNLIKDAIAYKEGKPTTNAGANITPDSGTNVDNVKNTGKLMCDYYASTNTVTKSHVGEETNNGCWQKCKEVATVTFGPPVATQAGMCFQYVVEVKSVVECAFSYLVPKPQPPLICYDTPKCTHSGVLDSNRAGPNDDFDSCVNSCDGGKYTQSCINSCYDKVYKKTDTTKKATTETTSKTLTYTTKNEKTNLATKVAKVDCINELTVDYNNLNMMQKLVEQKKLYPGGKVVNGKWVNTGAVCPSELATYYFRNADEAAKNLQAWRDGLVDQSGSVNVGYGTQNGILIRDEINGVKSPCEADCQFETGSKACGSDSVENYAEKYSNYEAELAKWEAAKNACEKNADGSVRTKPACSNDTSYYTIEVDQSPNGKKETTRYTAEQKQNSGTITGDASSIVKDKSGLCMTNSKLEDDYRVVLSFPQLYINNKTGRSTYKKPTKEYLYTYIGDEFCTKVTSTPTNTMWYYWKVDLEGDTSKLTSTQKQKISEETDYNIKVYVGGKKDANSGQSTSNNTGFGYFGWNFDINCFYAQIKNPNNKCDPNVEKCDGVDSPVVPADFLFRPVSLSNLFPNNRDYGFNWNCNGTNVENKNYLIQPTVVKDKIEALGESIYSDDAKYLDYEIDLSKEDINRIRNYNKTNKNYAYGDDDSEAGNNKTAGITVYKSAFLNQYSSIVKKRGLIGCNNQASSKTCDTALVTDTCYLNEYKGGN